MLVHHGRPDQSRRVALAPVDHCETTHGLAEEILTCPLPVGAVRSVTGERAVHDIRLLLGYPFVPEAQTFHGPGPVVLDYYVGLLDQPPDNLLAFLRAQVDA